MNDKTEETTEEVSEVEGLQNQLNYAQKIINPYMFICLCYLLVAIISIPFINIEEFYTIQLDLSYFF